MLWKKTNDEPIYIEKAKSQSNIDDLWKKLQQKSEKITALSGINVKVKGLNFSTIDTYKFIIKNDSYVFIRNIRQFAHLYQENELSQILEEPSIIFHQKDYSCLNISEEPVINNSEITCEKEYVVQGIKFRLINNRDNNQYIDVCIDQFNQDFTPYRDFLISLNAKNYYNIIDVPDESFSVKVVNGDDCLSNQEYQFFRIDNILYFVRRHPTSYRATVCIAQINVNDILYYKSMGELRYEQQISGGGGMGINYGSAILGGLLFGDAGAIIGSRRGESMEKIQSQTISHDERIVDLVFKINYHIHHVIFNFNSELAFDWLIPEKQYDYVIAKRRQEYENITQR